MAGSRVLSAVVSLSIGLMPALARSADQVVANCTNDTELRADLTAMQGSGGGTLTFSCASSTIVLTGDLPLISAATTIDGGDKVTISGGNARRIFFVDGAAALTLQKIVLSNGSTTLDGGAIYSNGSLSLKEVTIRNSAAGLSGGALVAYGATLIEDSELHSNKASNGGAVYARFSNAPVQIRRTSIHDNQATSGNGGGVFLWDGASVNIEDSVLSGNTAEQNGGGVQNSFANSSVTIRRSRIVENVATKDSGAGVHIGGGPLEIEDSEISGNVAKENGAGLTYRDGSSATVTGTTFSGNFSGYEGGAIFVLESTGASLVNVTISGNTAGTVSALYAVNSAVSLLHVTVAANDSGDEEGAVRHSANNGTKLSVKNVLMADNSDPNLKSSLGSIVSQDGNVSDDDSGFGPSPGPNDLGNAETLLGPLGLHGGRTPTHVPQPGSDAIDAGAFSASPSTDQRGFDRLQGASVDAGSVEVAACSGGAALCGDSNENGSITSSDALKALRTAVDSDSCELWSCDYDGNAKITAADALGILRASVGQPTMPACPPKWDCHPLGTE